MLRQKQPKQESIYNLIPKPPPQQREILTYDSKFKVMVKDEVKKVKRDHRTMGLPKEPIPNPNEYLKAHEKEVRLATLNPPILADQHHRCNEKLKAPVPDQFKDRPLLGTKTNKNFISQNAVDTIMAVPRKPERNTVDTRKGDKYSVDPSGLTPLYVKKKDFGNVPDYIVYRKEEAKNSKEDYEAYMSEYFKRGAMKTMTDDEREAILNGKFHFKIYHFLFNI
jgi:hypothetical protein